MIYIPKFLIFKLKPPDNRRAKLLPREPCDKVAPKK